MRRRNRVLLAVGAGALAWLCLWPVPVEPVAWHAPDDPGYASPFTPNEALAGAELLDLGARTGPEDFAIDPQGRLYVSTREGAILRQSSEGLGVFAETGGHPLGMAFDAAGTLWVADPARGLLAVDPAGQIHVALDRVGDSPLRYIDDLDVAPNGDVWFTDATRFDPKAFGGTLAASLLDIIEHGGHGRLIRFTPSTGEAVEVLAGLHFANGVAVDPGGAFVLVVETGAYRVTRYHLTGPAAGTHDTFAGPFPGFPDNIERGADGRYRVGLISPRNRMMDALDGTPFVRKMIWRLPGFIRPGPKAYGHLLTFDATGTLLDDQQDPSGRVSFVTGGQVHGGFLYLSSLKMTALARLPWKAP